MHPDVEDVVETARERAEAAESRFDAVEPRPFVDRVREVDAAGMNPVIAELKPTSPTTPGVDERDPVALARSMERGGAAALSVLTEPSHFGGSLDYLERIRAAVDVPVLRKDFVVDERMVREVEADLLLLIAAFLDDLDGMVAATADAGFEPLVEVHTEGELDAALATDARVVGVNNRDLTRLEVDLGVGDRLLPTIPDDRIAVAESGITGPDDVRRMRDAGADALLVGTAIMAEDDVEAKTRELVEA